MAENKDAWVEVTHCSGCGWKYRIEVPDWRNFDSSLYNASTEWGCPHCGKGNLANYHPWETDAQRKVRELIEHGNAHVFLTAKYCPDLKIPVRSADEASAAWQTYRDGNNLGSSETKRGCGEIRTYDGEVVAYVSYNGRVWAGKPGGKVTEQVLLQEACHV